jgi:predicted DCC family thiol-disulfide oxidoreductase YuxK
MQSPQGQKLIQSHNLHKNLEKDPSIVLFEPAQEPNKYHHYMKSTAALRIGQHLDGAHWRALGHIFMWVPQFFRDWVYELIAKNRYKYKFLQIFFLN